jgi:hypothetical protein
MNIGKILLGLLLLALIPTHWFIGGVVISSLTGISGILIGIVWLALLIAGITLIFNGLTEPDVVIIEKHKNH